MIDVQDAQLMPKEGFEVSKPEQVFAVLMKTAQAAVERTKGITVTDPADVRGMKAAREARLELRRIRLDGEKAHKELKADILRAGRAIDGMKNIMLQTIEPEENRLEDQEKLAERIQKERDAALQTKREGELADFGEDPSMHGCLYVFADQVWADKIEGLKMMREAKAKREREEREAAECKAAEEADESERIRLENERLKEEAKAREAAHKAEQDRIAAERAKESEAQRIKDEKVRKELEALKLKADTERKAREAAEQAIKDKSDQERKDAVKAAQAPDMDKLSVWVAAFALPTCAELTTEKAKAIYDEITKAFPRFPAWAKQQIEGVK